MNCKVCGNEIKDNWKYCRYCGTKLKDTKPSSPKLDEIKSEIREEMRNAEEPHIEEGTKVETEQQVFDKELYYRVLASRSKRRQLAEKKSELLEEVESWLEQVKSGIVKTDYAKPRIEELKKEVKKIIEEEKQYNSLPEELPIEVLLDQIEEAREKFNKLREIKKSSNISKETIREAKQQYLENLELLEGQRATVNGYLRKWLDELKEEINKKRRERENLYLKKELEEITEEEYKKRNNDLVEKIAELDHVIKSVQMLLAA